MWDFLYQNWVAVVSLLVALLGGIPGIMKVAEYLRQRPRFRVSVPATVSGTTTLANGRIVGFLMPIVWLTNLGTQALCPVSFTLEWRKKQKQKWQSLPLLVIEKFLETKIEQKGIYRFTTPPGPNLAQDKQQIMPGEMGKGYLLFMTNPTPPEVVLSSRFRLTVTDNLGNSYRWMNRRARAEKTLEPGRMQTEVGITREGDAEIPPLG